MIAGSVYGVVLNDAGQRQALSEAFAAKPYGASPEAPVVYIKPRMCVTFGGAPVPVPAELNSLLIAATIAVLFGDAPGVPVAAALALDVRQPHDSYYRPAIRQSCRDGFLPVGRFAGYDTAALAGDIVTFVDDVAVHRWSLDRLVRDVPVLIADLMAFMTLADGDVLLVGLPGDAPQARAGQSVRVVHDRLPPLDTRLVAEGGA